MRALALTLLLAACGGTPAANAEPCTDDGAQRCADDGTKVEQCTAGYWDIVDACAAGHFCAEVVSHIVVVGQPPPLPRASCI